MMASRKSEAAAQKPRRASAKNSGMTQFIIVGIGIVIVIFAALLLFGGSGKKTAGPQARAAAADTLGGVFGGTRKQVAAKKAAAAAMNKANRAKTVHDSLMAKRHDERLKQGQAAMTAGGRTTRSASGGFTSGTATHVTSIPNELRAILTDNTGARSALVGERRLNVGDDVNGHKIVDVTGDAVKVEFGQNTYTVRVGEKVY